MFLTYSLLMIVSFFFKANLHEARIRKSLLAIFGQHVNYNKLAIFFSANMDEAAKGQVCEILDVSTTSNHGTYLGLPLQIGKKRSVVFNFIKE